MSSTKFVPIECDGEQAPEFSVTLLDRSLGALSDSLEVRMQDSLKAAFHKHCRRRGCDMSERIRELMALDCFGADHVRTLIASQLDVIGVGAQHLAQPAAPADAPAAVRTAG